MKYIALAAFLVAVGCSPNPSYSVHGEAISTEDALSTEAFLAVVSSDQSSFKVRGIVEEVCQSKGCWLKLKNEKGQSIRVTFKDYGFFVPKDISGREVILEGEASMVMLEEDMARHFADDAGVEYDPSMRKEVAIEAKGVLVKDI